MGNKPVMRFWLLRLAACAVLMSAPVAAAKEYALRAVSSKFYVVDGDSVNYGKLKFRLCGIQAPERSHPLYRQTTLMLKNLFGRKRISAHVRDIDKYKRKVVVMFAAGEKVSVNEKMVRLGGARHYRRFSKNCAPYVYPAQFAAAEKRAKKRRLGIWARK